VSSRKNQIEKEVSLHVASCSIGCSHGCNQIKTPLGMASSGGCWLSSPFHRLHVCQGRPRALIKEKPKINHHLDEHVFPEDGRILLLQESHGVFRKGERMPTCTTESGTHLCQKFHQIDKLDLDREDTCTKNQHGPSNGEGSRWIYKNEELKQIQIEAKKQQTPFQN
jgi:hypothetical protein